MNGDFDAYEEKDTESLDALDAEDSETVTDVDKDTSVNVKKSGTGRTEIVGIRFRKNGKTYYFAPGDFKLTRDDRVIVDTARGQEYGYTAVPNRMINDSEIIAPLRRVVRMAGKDDTAIHEENLKREIDAFNSCIMLIDENKLEMKLIDVEMSFDRSKLMFYFSAEGRVDFRDLVKELASKFKTRIEMRQIGIRDEAKILGGLGVCGRPFCCSSFLSDFVQVSVKMAKEQNLSLNSAKISGACGRLMCCLRYEYDTYLAEKALTPKVDTRVMTPDGAGVVTAANPLAGIVKVRLDKAANDTEQVAFLREDVVKESEYKGEKLVKRAIPERKHKEEQDDPFGFDIALETTETASRTAPDKNEPKPKAVEKNDRDRSDRQAQQAQQVQHDQKRSGEPAVKSENTGADKQRQNGEKGKRNEQRNRHDGHKDKRTEGEQRVQNAPSSDGKQPQNQDKDQNQNGKKKNNHHNRQRHDRRDAQNDRRNVGETVKNEKPERNERQERPERAERNVPEQKDAQRAEKPSSQNTEKKKNFRPYYKNHRKNNKNRSGDNQGKINP